MLKLLRTFSDFLKVIRNLALRSFSSCYKCIDSGMKVIHTIALKILDIFIDAFDLVIGAYPHYFFHQNETQRNDASSADAFRQYSNNSN